MTDGRRRGAGRGGRGRSGRAQDPTAELGARLTTVLERLPEAQAQVLRHRMGLVDGQPHSLADTARALGLSLTDARDIEQRAFAHIREVVPVEDLQRFLGPGSGG